MMQLDLARKWFLHTALHYLGTLYIWGGDDPTGFDCSGYVLECLQACGAVRPKDDMTADLLWKRFQGLETATPSEGCLIFRFNAAGTAVHVQICLDELHTIGADGGGSKDTDAATAAADNAYVKIRPIGEIGNRRIVNPFSQGTI